MQQNEKNDFIFWKIFGLSRNLGLVWPRDVSQKVKRLTVEQGHRCGYDLHKMFDWTDLFSPW